MKSYVVKCRQFFVGFVRELESLYMVSLRQPLSASV